MRRDETPKTRTEEGGQSSPNVWRENPPPESGKVTFIDTGAACVRAAGERQRIERCFRFSSGRKRELLSSRDHCVLSAAFCD